MRSAERMRFPRESLTKIPGGPTAWPPGKTERRWWVESAGTMLNSSHSFKSSAAVELTLARCRMEIRKGTFTSYQKKKKGDCRYSGFSPSVPLTLPVCIQYYWRHLLAWFSVTIAASSSLMSAATTSSRTCLTEVALAIGAVIPGRAISQANAICAGVA